MADDADGPCLTVRPEYQFMLPTFERLGQEKVCGTLSSKS